MSSGLTSLSVVYTDHSLMVWNISNINSVSLVKQFNYHSSCVWGVDSYQGGLSSGNISLLKFLAPVGSFINFIFYFYF